MLIRFADANSVLGADLVRFDCLMQVNISGLINILANYSKSSEAFDMKILLFNILCLWLWHACILLVDFFA